MAIDIRSIAEFGDREPDLYWSRKPGRFISATTGKAVRDKPFQGTIQEWFETLPILLLMHMPKANFLVVCPDTAVIIEHSILFTPAYHFNKYDTYMGKLRSIDVYKSLTIPYDRFIAMELIDDAFVADLKVGKVVK